VLFRPGIRDYFIGSVFITAKDAKGAKEKTPCFYNREKRERPRKSRIGLILIFRALSRLSQLIKIPSRPSRFH
jgi:hypothetical protein